MPDGRKNDRHKINKTFGKVSDREL